MIITLTLNPAVDKTVEINDFRLGSVNRVSSFRLDAGGKGINVSKVIKELGGNSKAMGLIAGRNGEFIEGYLNKLNIENDFVQIDGETRTNIKIIDNANKVYTDINEPGFMVSQEDINVLTNKLLSCSNGKSVVVFSGSIPVNMNNDIYIRLISDVKKKGAKTILDADGELLKEGIKEGPYIVKPNIHELQKAFNIEVKSKRDIRKIAEQIFEFGVTYVIVSLGEEGSVFVSKEKTAFVKGIPVEVKSTVGAGDSMVAALAMAIDNDYSYSKAIKLSVAASTASCMVEGTQAGSLKKIREIEKAIQICYL